MPASANEIQLNFRAQRWMREHLKRRAQQESSPVARSSVTAILCALIIEDAKHNPTGADRPAA